MRRKIIGVSLVIIAIGFLTLPMGQLGYYPLGFGTTFLLLALFVKAENMAGNGRTCNSCGFRWMV